MNRVELNGVQTYCFSSRNELIEFVLKERKSLIAVNAEKILHSTIRSRELLRENIGYTDGIGAVWALRKKGFTKAVKIPGCELWLDIIRESYDSKTFYLIGSIQSVIETTVEKLRKQFPGIIILNFRNGYINNDSERQELFKDILLRRPDIVFVAMGSPAQEELIDAMLRFHPAVYQGLGGSFDVYSGIVRRAPEWWITHNMEWAFRLMKQPLRIKRQIHLIRFFFLLVMNRI